MSAGWSRPVWPCGLAVHQRVMAEDMSRYSELAIGDDMDDFAENDLDHAADSAALRFDLDQAQARELVDLVANAFTEGGDAVEDAAWDVQDREPGVTGEDFVDDVAENLGYDLS